MPRINPPENGAGTPFRRILSMRPHIAAPWTKLDETLRFSGMLDAALKEEVRRTLAAAGGCAFCASLGDPATSHADPKTAAATAFAAAVGADPTGISDETWRNARAVFSEAEMIELCIWICFMYGSEMFGGIMRLEPATADQVRMYSDWLKAGAAKDRRDNTESANSL